MMSLSPYFFPEHLRRLKERGQKEEEEDSSLGHKKAVKIKSKRNSPDKDEL